MEHLPIYIPATFILTTLLTVILLYKAGAKPKRFIITAIAWLIIQAVIALSGFYLVTKGIPPRFGLLLIPPALTIAILFLTKKGRLFVDGFDAKKLTLIYTVRIPVELTLYWLFVYKTVPQVMTFEGHNFDVLCGLTAPLIYYFGYVKNSLGRNVLLIWNFACLALLANVVITAVLSVPLAFQQLAFDQPNIALLYFPFMWLPCFVVPAVLFAHLASIRKLIINKI